MKSMLIAATVVGAAIAGLMLYVKNNPGSMDASQMRDRSKKIIAGKKKYQVAQS